MGRKSVKQSGTLIVIGGHEDKQGEMVILSEVARRIGNGKLCVATVASQVGQELWEDYRRAFRALGVRKISHLDVVNRAGREDARAHRAVEGCAGVFFTGGDQLRITSELGGTEIVDRILAMYRGGGVIAGTSAGASVMSETMLVAGAADSSFRVGSSLRMAPGLGFIPGVIIDQHFAERGRIGRLLGAIAQNPKFIGIGIDENTAIVTEDERNIRVIGAGAVYVLDAHEASGCNISEAEQKSALSLFNVRLHTLSHGDGYRLGSRDLPVKLAQRQAA